MSCCKGKRRIRDVAVGPVTVDKTPVVVRVGDPVKNVVSCPVVVAQKIVQQVQFTCIDGFAIPQVVNVLVPVTVDQPPILQAVFPPIVRQGVVQPAQPAIKICPRPLTTC